MDCSELFEDFKIDHTMMTMAQSITSAWSKWLSSRTEDGTLSDVKDIYIGHQPHKGGTLTYVKATNIGLEFDDLFLGFVYGSTADSQAALLRGLDEGKRIYFAVSFVKFDPMTTNDIGYKLNWSHIHHELIHYLDYGRGLEFGGNLNNNRDKRVAQYKDAAKNPESFKKYSNDSLELNAHYHEGLNDLIATFKRLSWRLSKGYSLLNNFKDFNGYVLALFRNDWLSGLDDNNQRKLIKRLYGVFQYLKEKYNEADDIQTKAEIDRKFPIK